jgi:CheY-like chemotaxis protein
MSTPKLLLCIEDDEDDCAWIEEAAREADHKLVFVNKQNGRDALMFLNRQKEHNYLPCLILLDINMPVMDGKQTLAALKKDAVFQTIPVVMFSTSSTAADRLFCEHLGVELISKPNQLSEFKRLVHDLVVTRCA